MNHLGINNENLWDLYTENHQTLGEKQPKLM